MWSSLFVAVGVVFTHALSRLVPPTAPYLVSRVLAGVVATCVIQSICQSELAGSARTRLNRSPLLAEALAAPLPIERSLAAVHGQCLAHLLALGVVVLGAATILCGIIWHGTRGQLFVDLAASSPFAAKLPPLRPVLLSTTLALMGQVVGFALLLFALGALNAAAMATTAIHRLPLGLGVLITMAVNLLILYLTIFLFFSRSDHWLAVTYLFSPRLDLVMTFGGIQTPVASSRGTLFEPLESSLVLWHIGLLVLCSVIALALSILLWRRAAKHIREELLRSAQTAPQRPAFD